MEPSRMLPPADWATWGALLVAIVLGVFSIWQHLKAERVRVSRDFLDAAVRRLEQAYTEFLAKASPKWAGLPEPDRLLWLSVARLLREATETATQITEPSHKIQFEHARTFWRGKFYDLLLPLNTIPLTFFSESPDKAIVQIGGDRSPISPKSLKVLLDFTKWPEGVPDPLDGVGSFSLDDAERMQTFGPRSVGAYIDALDAMRSEPTSRQEYWRKEWDKPRD